MRLKNFIRIGMLLLLCAPIVFALVGCEENAPSSSFTPQSTAQSPGEVVVKIGFSPAAVHYWPPAPQKGEAVAAVLAADILARNFYLVADFSASMSWSACESNEKREVVARRVLEEVALAIPDDANVGLLAFSGDGIKERVPLGLAFITRTAFLAAVGKLKAGGGTPLSSAIEQGYQKLMAQARRQRGYGEYHLIVVTDGEANPGYNPTSIVKKITSESPVMISVAGFCLGPDHSLNQRGRTNYKEANSPAALREALLKVVLAETHFSDIVEVK